MMRDAGQVGPLTLGTVSLTRDEEKCVCHSCGVLAAASGNKICRAETEIDKRRDALLCSTDVAHPSKASLSH